MDKKAIPPATGETIAMYSKTTKTLNSSPVVPDLSAASSSSSSSRSPPAQRPRPPVAPAEPQRGNFNHHFKKYELLLELKNLSYQDQSPPGVYVIPSEDNFFVWNCVMFLRKCGTIQFKSHIAVVKFNIEIPADYPQRSPQVKFITKVIHPLVRPSDAAFDLSYQFPKWNPEKDRICHILYFVRNAFAETFLETLEEQFCTNKDAFRLYKNDPESFKNATLSWGEESISEAYSVDEGAFKIPDLDKDKYDAAHKEFFQGAETMYKPEPTSSGMSIMETLKRNLWS